MQDSFSLPALSGGHADLRLRSPSWSGVLGGLGGKVKSWFYVRQPGLGSCRAPKDKGVSLQDCLRRYCAPEYLTGKAPAALSYFQSCLLNLEDQYYCERCKRKIDCEKRMVFKATRSISDIL